jgi:hypothetical protein
MDTIGGQSHVCVQLVLVLGRRCSCDSTGHVGSLVLPMRCVTQTTHVELPTQHVPSSNVGIVCSEIK